MSNTEIIEMHLEEFARQYPGQTWASMMGFVIGYYDKVNMDHIVAIQSLQQRGIIKR